MARADRKMMLGAFRRLGKIEGKIPDVGRLLAIAAHDLRNPVSGIMSASEYLLEDAADLLESEHLAVLRSIESSSRQMLAVIDDISEIAALESGKLQTDAQPKDIVRMIRGVIAQNRPGADRKGIHIDLQAQPEMPPVEMDSARVHRAVHRLIGMSIGSAPEGAGIGIRVAKAGDHVAITVSTDGALLPGAHGLRPGDAASTLSALLVELVVEAHGGTIEAGSDSRKGQVFQLTLPLSARSRPHRP